MKTGTAKNILGTMSHATAVTNLSSGGRAVELALVMPGSLAWVLLERAALSAVKGGGGSGVASEQLSHAMEMARFSYIIGFLPVPNQT